MTAITNQPNNINQLFQLGARMVLQRAPDVVFWCQDIVIPSITVGTADYQTELDYVPLPGESLTRGTLDVSIRVDEDLKNYNEIYDWMIALTYPDSHSQYAGLKTAGKAKPGSGILSDITIILNDSAQRPNIQFDFQDAFPVYISQLRFSTKDSSPVPLDLQISFKFRHFTNHSLKV